MGLIIIDLFWKDSFSDLYACLEMFAGCHSDPGGVPGKS